MLKPEHFPFFWTILGTLKSQKGFSPPSLKDAILGPGKHQKRSRDTFCMLNKIEIEKSHKIVLKVV